MDSVKKRLILPLIIFVSIMVMNISSIISGIEEHQTWRITIASVSSVLMLGAVIIIFIRLSKAKKQETSGNE
jgi:F0F1-type ATP synthase membrane subunit a